MFETETKEMTILIYC